MPRRRDKRFTTFNDGTLSLYETDRRTLTRLIISGIRYGKHTVGARRYYDALMEDTEISKAVKIPLMQGIQRNYVAVIEGKQYRIEQVQEKFDQKPPYLLLTLEDIYTDYEDRTNETDTAGT